MKKEIAVLFTALTLAAVLTACGGNPAPTGAASDAEGPVRTKTEASALGEAPAPDGQAAKEDNGIMGESVLPIDENASEGTSQPDMEDPFTEFLYAPYQSENAFEDINSAEAADTYRRNQGVENEGSAKLESGVELFFSSGESWDLDTGESFDSVYLELTGTEAKSGQSVRTYYSYTNGDLSEVVTDFGAVKDASAAGLPSVGGFADYAAKYNCFTIADFFRAFGMNEAELMKALEENAVLYQTSFETDFGTVEVTLDDYSMDEVKNRQAAIDFPDGTSSPWKKVLLAEYEDSMAVHAWTEAYLWLY